MVYRKRNGLNLFQLLRSDLTLLQSVLEPYGYIHSSQGKGIRTQLLKAFNVWLHVPPGVVERIRNVVNILHNASLM